MVFTFFVRIHITLTPCMRTTVTVITQKSLNAAVPSESPGFKLSVLGDFSEEYTAELLVKFRICVSGRL